MTIEDVILMPAGAVIGREIVDASFEEWISFVFDRSTETRHSKRNEDDLGWATPASRTVEFIGKTFEESGTLLKQFNDDQVADGLEYISNGNYSDVAHTLRDESVLLHARQNTIHSIRKLYSDCFALRCLPKLSHGSTDTEPLNSICYMWWDVFPVCGSPEKAEGTTVDAECLAVMEFALGLESDVCRESALHGLGHWFFGYPDFVQKTIDRFIISNPNANPKLLTYARAAQRGDVQ